MVPLQRYRQFNLVLDGVTFYDVILSTHTYQVVLVWLPLLPFGLSQSLEV